MRTRQVFRAFLSFAIVVGLICILYINFSQNFPKQKEQLVKDSIAILEKGIEIVDDFRKKHETNEEKVKGLAISGASVESAGGKLGIADTRGKDGVVDTRDKDGVVDTLGKEGVVKTRGKDGVVDTRAKEGVVDTRGKEGVVDTRAKKGMVDTRDEEGVVDTRSKEGMADSRGKESVFDTLGKGVMDKHDKEVVVNTHRKEGTVDTRMKEHVVNTRAKEGVADTRAKEDVADTRREEGVVNTHGKKSVFDTGDKEDKANTNGGANMTIRSDEVQKENPKPKRQSLLMIGHDRSGTTFINRMFNEDPNVFNVYEPLWITKGIGPPEKHQEVIIDAMNGILNCNFSATNNGITFLAKISQWIAVRLNSKAMMSHPFCKIKNGERVCENMPPKLADEVCATRYKYSVTKLAVTRIPNEKISSILRRLLDENPHTRVLYMLRDPRGTINSRINLRWMKEYPDPGMQNGVKSVCETTTYNLRYMQILMKKSEYRDRCMIIRYKDISANPLAIAKKIYKFARFQIEPRLTDWIMNHTNPSKEKLKLESYNHYSVVRNATGNADKWRKEAPVERVRMINNVCAPLLRLLGISDQD
ncbi:carbohydrate sulfotransferase 3-like [Actinia tenebrosa]|uniref:Carbohydrate sulfotransferase 3-like n=1 Tax=Actinia tenebrosa TaxID=6105 RepID=A0A6P8HU70_ACTTE|nr:carbohydrate sulfotransferase 3-like [Actinia tenebrosa]XP_031556173.1 carbohydrate sulfotransferase 3-like [Actinia tenebrosa]